MSARRRRLRLYQKLLRGSFALGLAGSLLLPGKDASAIPDNMVIGGGLFVAYHFGERSGFGLGAEAYTTYLVSGEADACGGSRSNAGLGPLLQFGLVNFGDPRLTLALQGGGTFTADTPFSLAAEAGATYHFSAENGFGLHLGLTPQFSIVNLFARLGVGHGDFSAGVGLRSSTPFSPLLQQCIIEGRPLRSDGGAIVAQAKIEDEWLCATQSEHASVFAFAELARALVAAEAPPALITRALNAGEDELRHTIGSAKMALKHAKNAIFTPPHFEPRQTFETGLAAYKRLAVESWLDGCLNEGVAAKAAELDAVITRDRDVRQLKTTIAREEAEHAQLAWDVLRWSIDRGGDEVRHELWKLRDHAPRVERAELEADVENYRRALHAAIA